MPGIHERLPCGSLLDYNGNGVAEISGRAVAEIYSEDAFLGTRNFPIPTLAVRMRRDEAHSLGLAHGDEFDFLCRLSLDVGYASEPSIRREANSIVVASSVRGYSAGMLHGKFMLKDMEKHPMVVVGFDDKRYPDSMGIRSGQALGFECELNPIDSPIQRRH